MNEKRGNTENTLVALLNESVKMYGDDIALRRQIPGEPRSDRGWTYSELQKRAHSVSNYLLNHGVNKGDRVMIISDNLPESVAIKFGAYGAGVVSVPVDQHLRVESMYGNYADLIEPDLMVVDPKYDPKIRKHCGKFPIVSLEDVFKGEATDPKIEVNSEDIATIIFSSGTGSVFGGDPKAAMLSHGNIFYNIWATEYLHKMIEKTDGAKQETYLAGLEKHWHILGELVLMSTLSVGGRAHFTSIDELKKGNAAHINPHYMVMVPKSAKDTLEEIRQGIVSERGERVANLYEWFLKKSNKFHYQKRNENKFRPILGLAHLVGNGIFYREIRKKLKDKFGRNKISFLGGSADLPLYDEMSFNTTIWPIFDAYGLTESPAVSVVRSENYLFGYSGELIPGTVALTVDPDMAKKGIIKPVGEGEEGLLLIKSPGVFQGYYGDLESTEKAFLQGWLNTGDLAILDGKSLKPMGRVDDEFKLSLGEKVSPHLIENHYSSLNMLVVGEDRERVGGLIISENGQLEEDVLKEAYAVLSDSREKFGIEFPEGSLGVIHTSEEDYTNTLKFRRKAVLKKHSSKIDTLCN